MFLLQYRDTKAIFYLFYKVTKVFFEFVIKAITSKQFKEIKQETNSEKQHIADLRFKYKQDKCKR